MKGGAAKGAQAAMEMLSLVGPRLEAEMADPTLPPGAAEEIATFLANGRQIEQWLLDHVHGVAGPGVTPDLMNLKRGLDALSADVGRMLANAR
jgi:hypothetical protein